MDKSNRGKRDVTGSKKTSAPKSPTAHDPWYSKTISNTSGLEISGTAALLQRVKASGGMSAIIQDVARDTFLRAQSSQQQAYLSPTSDHDGRPPRTS